MVKKIKKKVTVKNEKHSEPGKSMNQEDENVEIEQQINIEENKVSKSEVKEMEPVEDAFPKGLNQGVKEDVKEREQFPITVLSEEEERSLSDEARVHTKHDIHTHSEEETMSRGRKRKVVQLASIKHQEKVLKMLGEVGTTWRPKTRTKNKLNLNMKKVLNPKLAEKKITVIEDSSSQEELEDNEDQNKEIVKGKKKIVSENKPVFTETKISKIFMEVRKKMILEQHQNDLKRSCVEK